MSQRRLRVLVVEDSRTVRERLCEVLRAQPDIDVVGQGDDGRQAIELCRELRPDVVTLDMVLPVMSGLAATEYIMAYCPTPILIVSASDNRGEVHRTYDALAAGAVDVLDKPGGRTPDDEWERQFLAAVRMVARIRVITHPRGRLAARRPTPLSSPIPAGPALASARSPLRVVALGASTGGPAALVEVLRGIPAHGPVPILMLLHVGELFSSTFADWLDGQTPHRVALARDGETLASHAGRVVMAPPERHLVVSGGHLRLTAGPERHSCRPSIDVLFESVAAEYGAAAAGALLTGMGRDGAAGLLALRRAGAYTIAQDEATSVVYGMPREAALIGAAERVLPLPEIGTVLAQLIAAGRRAGKGGAP